MNRTLKPAFSIIILLFFILTGCGGGGGDSDAGINPLQLSTSTVSVTLGAGASSTSRTVVITLPANTHSLAAGYSGGQTKPSWVNYSFSPFYISDTTADFNIGLNTNGLSMGSYSDSIIVEAREIGGTLLASSTVRVNLTINDPLKISADRLDFYTAFAASATPVNTISLSRISTPGTWSASANQPWLTLSKATGSTPDNFDIGVDLAGMDIGSYTATLSITDDVTSEITDIPVTLKIEPHRLSVIDNGVALSHHPSRSRLSHTIEIGENGGSGTAWSAVSDQAWLSLSTATGVTGNTLTLTADPAGLAVDSIHYANVTISSTDPSIVNSETVSVGFYISSTDALTTTAFAGLVQTDYPSGLVADPIRPYVYVSNLDSGISVYNVYSGTLVTTISGDVNDRFSELEVSSDGSYLYAVNRFNNTIKRADLSTMTIVSTWSGFRFPVYSSTPFLSQMDIRYARINGYPVLVTSGTQVLDAADGSVLAEMGDYAATYFRPPMIALSPDGTAAFASLANYAYFDLYRYRLWYSYINNSAIAYLAQARPRLTFENSPLDMAMNHTGTHLMTVQQINISDYLRTYNNDENMNAVARDNYGSNTAVVAVTHGPTGRIYTVKRASVADDTVYIYDGSYNALSSITVPAYTVNRKLVTSGDGMRLILRTNNASDAGIVMVDITP